MKGRGSQIRTGVILAAVLSLSPVATAQAGMPFYMLNDLYRLRLEEISFFLLLLLVCGLLFKWLWNGAFAGFAAVPRLRYKQSLAMTCLFGLVMLLVLTMISGIREVLTPGAWRRQGATYQLNSPTLELDRRRSLEYLRHALFEYAKGHDGRFPPHDFVPEIPGKLWESPDQGGTRYVYSGGYTLEDSGVLLAVEPSNFGDRRLGLLVSGEIQAFSHEEIQERLKRRNKP